MATQNLQVWTKIQLLEDIKNRFYPRDLILSSTPSGPNTNDDPLLNCLDRAIEQLNKYCYFQRFWQAAISGYVVDCSTINITGVEVKKVTEVMPTQAVDSIFSVYTQLMGNTPFYYNLIRNQDTFIEFALTKQLNDNLNKQYKNKSTGYMFNHRGDLLLDPKAYSSQNVGNSVVLFFYPHFKTSSDTTGWEMFDVEKMFVGNYLEALIMYREGRAMSELGFTDLVTNAEKYMTDGTENMEKEIKTFKSGGLKMIGKRF